MTYHFSKLTNRFDTHSLKWDVKDYELPMWVADMDFETAPEIVEALHQRVNHRIFGYNTVPDEFFDSIIAWWKRRHQLTIQKEWMMYCTGVVPAISSIVRKMTTVGENVLIQSPVYNIFYNSIVNNGRRVLSSDLIYDGQQYAIDFLDLERKLAMPQTTLMILCNPHNPIGKIWDKETLEHIGYLCAKYHVLVVSDEIHCDIVEPGKGYIPFASLSTTLMMNSITCVAPTKAFNLAGLQTACLIIPNADIRHKVNRAINTDEIAEPNSFATIAAITAFQQGEKWLDELNHYIANNKRVAIQHIQDYLPMLHVVESEATYLLWIDCSKICYDSIELVEYLRSTTGLYLSEGYEYGENGKTFVRMNVACPLKRLEDGLERLTIGITHYQKEGYIMNQEIIHKMRQFEDVINMEALYQQDTQQILKQYYYQKGLYKEDLGFHLSDDEMRILDALILI